MILTQKLVKEGDLYTIHLSQEAVDAFGWIEGQDIQIHESTAQPGITLCGPVHAFKSSETFVPGTSGKGTSNT